MARRKKPRSLTDTEKDLWQKVTKDVTPIDTSHVKPIVDMPPIKKSLHRSAASIVPQQNLTFDPDLPMKLLRGSPKEFQKPTKSKNITKINAGDDNIPKKLGRGRLDIEATLDLHGLTQELAYTRVQQFFTQAHLTGIRYVLVVTGKGDHGSIDAPLYQVGRGILRRRFLEWVDGPFKHLVSSVHTSRPHHGGTGAFYVHIKRAR